MAQRYRTVTSYLSVTRLSLQDMVAPYRHPDSSLLIALNIAINEMGRIRPDMYLDLKYQQPLGKGDIDDGLPQGYTSADVATNADGSYNVSQGTLVPIPSKYTSAVDWFMSGWTQFLDVTDTQDQRAQAFIVKFQSHLTTLTAA
jgi:hypothetical protein